MIIYNEELKEKVSRLKEIKRIEDLILELEKRHEKDSEILEELAKLKEYILELQEKLPNDNHKKYLSEIILEEKPQFLDNNLIIAPIGSGKTTLIKEVLIDKTKNESSLLLISSRFLKDSLNEDINKSQIVVEDSEDRSSLRIMTYHEFGLRIRNSNKFLDGIDKIFCDEIHSLPEYRDYDGSKNSQITHGLEHAMKYLFNKQPNKQIFYFTATTHNLEKLKKERHELVEDIVTFDYRNHPDIKKYMELSKSYITHIEQIRPYLRERKEAFDYFGSKGLAFTKTIVGLKAIEEILIEEGFTPLVLWSDANDKYELSEAQKLGRQELIDTNRIPSGYDFLLINSSMREGWDLKDPKVRIAIMNTSNETDIVQSRGRIRKDIDLIVYKTNDILEKLSTLDLKERYINVPLTTEDKENLCIELDLRDRANRLKKWRTVRGVLEQNGYIVNDAKYVYQGKRQVVTTITIKTSRD